jgi:eukaryotic-like serine/threonine-protein kinase
VEQLRLSAACQDVSSVAFSRDGARVLTGSSDQTARLWDAATGKELRAFKGYEGYVYSVAFTESLRRRSALI